MKYRLAVVEDDELIREMITINLEKNGYAVASFSSAESMLDRAGKDIYDLIILDIVLPGVSGGEFLQTVRQRGDNTPVLMLTVKSDMPTRIEAFDSGADDYMVKPFSMDELLARVKALIRRSLGKRRIPSSKIMVINGHRINTSTRLCESNMGEVALSEKEMNFLLYLTEHSHETLSRADILEEVWGMDVSPTPRTVDNFIMKFRKLFEDNPERPKHFISVRNRGYRFES